MPVVSIRTQITTLGMQRSPKERKQVRYGAKETKKVKNHEHKRANYHPQRRPGQLLCSCFRPLQAVDQQHSAMRKGEEDAAKTGEEGAPWVPEEMIQTTRGGKRTREQKKGTPPSVHAESDSEEANTGTDAEVELEVPRG